MGKDKNSKNFRLKGKFLFLTYPQNPVNKEETLKNCQELFKDNLKDYIIANEKHKDGNLHGHIWLELKEPIDWKGDKCFKLLDPLTGKHGKYEIMRNPKHVMGYCTKENDWISSFDVEKRLKAMTGKRKYIATELLAGKNINDLIDENPEMLYDSEKWERAQQAYKRRKYIIRHSRPKVYVIKGEPGSGKTEWPEHKWPDKSIYRISDKHSNRYSGSWDGYEQQDIVIIDECDKFMFSWDFTLRLLDKYPIKVRMMYGTAQFNSPIICLTGVGHYTEWWIENNIKEFEERVYAFIDTHRENDTFTFTETLNPHCRK